MKISYSGISKFRTADLYLYMFALERLQAATEFRFESVPELKYDAEADPPAGEILIRGPMVGARPIATVHAC
jgi:hypothetical protein